MKLRKRFINPLFFLTVVLLVQFNVEARAQTSAADSIALKFDNLKNLTKKGSRMAGGTLSLKFKNSTDKNELIRYVEENKTYDFAIRIDGAYAFADYNFAGVALQYGQSGYSGDFQNTDGQVYTEDFFGTQFTFAPFLKNLTPIDSRGRFNINVSFGYKHQIVSNLMMFLI
jgi:hypothetical protein